MQEQQQVVAVPQPQEVRQSPQRIYYSPEVEALEQKIRREIAVKHKLGDLWLSRHNEEILGLLRDPTTPLYVHDLVNRYCHEWREHDDAIDEVIELQEDLKNATEPLDIIHQKQNIKITKKNLNMRRNRIAELLKMIHANKVMPQGLELYGEKEYRDLGIGKIFAASESVVTKRRRSVVAATVTRGSKGDEEPADFE